MSKVNHDHKCPCGKVAKYSASDELTVDIIDEDGNFLEFESYPCVEPVFYCEDCGHDEFNF